jgi:periplasmic protein TonB
MHKLRTEDGKVRIRFVVGKDGLPRNFVFLQRASDGLNDAVMLAVERWRFAPGTRNGEPVSVFQIAEFDFRVF